jgi:trans-aconitate 2-methyltransferase
MKDLWNPTLYDSKHSFVTRYGEDVITLLDPKPGERILDVGCGTGHLTHQIAERGAEVIGLDQSPAMIAEAKTNYPQLASVQADAADFRFDQPFDAVFSNAALHWILTPEKVIASVWEALKPGGRFVAEMGGKGNVQAIADAVHGTLAAGDYPIPPKRWYFPTIGEYAALLEAQGFRATYMIHFDRPTLLEGEDAIGNFIRMYLPETLEGVPEAEQPAFIGQVEDALRPTLFYDDQWHADYVRLRFAAVKTSSRDPSL